MIMKYILITILTTSLALPVHAMEQDGTLSTAMFGIALAQLERSLQSMNTDEKGDENLTDDTQNENMPTEDDFLIAPDSLLTRCKKIETDLTALTKKINERLEEGIEKRFANTSTIDEKSKNDFLKYAEKILTRKNTECGLDLKVIKNIYDGHERIDHYSTYAYTVSTLEKWHDGLFIKDEDHDQEIIDLLLGNEIISYENFKTIILK